MKSLTQKLAAAVKSAIGQHHDHTREEWIVSPADPGIVIGTHTGRTIADCRARPGPEQENNANARLISEAPALFRALDDIIDFAEADIEDRRRLIDSDDAAKEVADAQRALKRARAALKNAAK